MICLCCSWTWLSTCSSAPSLEREPLSLRWWDNSDTYTSDSPGMKNQNRTKKSSKSTTVCVWHVSSNADEISAVSHVLHKGQSLLWCLQWKYSQQWGGGGWHCGWVNVGVLLWLVLRSVMFAGERIAVDGREGILAQWERKGLSPLPVSEAPGMSCRCHGNREKKGSEIVANITR